jgi:hypothetical protein
MANNPCDPNSDLNNVKFCQSYLFRSSAGSLSTARVLPNKGVGYIDFKKMDPYTGLVTNKIGTSSGNDTSISKAMRYSQYVNNPNPRGTKNTQTYSYKLYVEKYGPLPETNKSCYTNPAFQTNYK